MGHLLTLLRYPFQPCDLPGLALWLDGADPTTLALSGSNVTQWNDKSGNGRHVSQGTSTLQPTYDSTGLNNKPCITFAQDGLVYSTDFTLGALSIFAVFTNDNSFPISGSDVDFIVTHLPTGGGSANISLTSANGFVDTTEPQLRYENADASATLYINDTIAANPMSIMVNKAYIGGVIAPGNISASGGIGVGVTAQTGSSFGSYSGKISEVLIYSRALTSDEAHQINYYLAAKWGIV